MGYYINQIGTTFQDKVHNLKEKHQAEIIDTPTSFQENLVCVVDNGAFAAAAWMNNEREFQFWLPNDGRRKCWMIVPNAKELAD